MTSRPRLWPTAVAAAGLLIGVDARPEEPALRIGEGDYAVLPEAWLFRPDEADHEDGRALGIRYFGRVALEGRRADRLSAVAYTITGDAGKSGYQLCPSGGCADVAVGVRPESGLLYLMLDRPLEGTERAERRRAGATLVAEFPARRVELSVSDSGRRVYRDIAVLPSPKVPDCSDFPAQAEDRYVCLYLRENLPSARPVTPADVRAVLPSLTQPPANYELVLAEEFEGNRVDGSSGCANRMGNVDAARWNYGDPCDHMDIENVPCFNVEDGHAYVALSSRCRGTLETYGKFSYRYGYLETKFTVEFASTPYYLNMAFVQWGGARHDLQYDYDGYGISVDGYEALSKYVGVEIDHFEYLPQRTPEAASYALDVSHQYMNASLGIHHRGVSPRRVDKTVRHCVPAHARHELSAVPRNGCAPGGQITVVRGLEWTPRGYRTFVKVQDVHDDFVVLDRALVGLQERPVWPSKPGEFEFGPWEPLDENARERFFEYLVAGEPTSILEQFGIAHMPADLELTAWGYPGRSQERIGLKMKVDYVRVFQPRDRYAAMEPVYE